MDNETRVAGARAKNIRETWPKVVRNALGSFSHCRFVHYIKKALANEFAHLPALSPSRSFQTKASDSSVCTYTTHDKHNGPTQNSHHQPQHQSVNDRLPPRTYRESRLQQRTESPSPRRIEYFTCNHLANLPHYPASSAAKYRKNPITNKLNRPHTPTSQPPPASQASTTSPTPQPPPNTPSPPSSPTSQPTTPSSSHATAPILSYPSSKTTPPRPSSEYSKRASTQRCSC